MRAQEGTARRYAKALHAAAAEAGAGEAAGRELATLLDILQANRQAVDVLARPWIKPGDRRAAALTLAQQAGCGKLVQDFVALVAERGRLDHLAAIVAAYQELADAALGRVRAQVRTAVALTDAEKDQLARHLQSQLGKQSFSRKPWTRISWAASSPSSAVSFSTAVSTGSSRACASGW